MEAEKDDQTQGESEYKGLSKGQIKKLKEKKKKEAMEKAKAEAAAAGGDGADIKAAAG